MPPKNRLERLADDALRGGDPITQARKRKRAADNPQFARVLAQQGQHQRSLSRKAQAIAAKLADKEAFEAAARRQGELMLAQAEARQQELERIAEVVKRYDAEAKQHEKELQRRDAAAVQRYYPSVGARKEFENE